MTRAFDKLLNPFAILILNILIILAVELVGGGKFFFETGLIHAIAVFFIILAALRIFLHYYSYDAIFEKFVHGAIIAFVLFSVSHVVEFVSYVFLKLSYSAVYLNVVNFYAASLLAIAAGAENFLYHHDERKPYSVWLMYAGIGIFIILSIASAINRNLISLEFKNPAPYIYAVGIFFIGLLAFVKVLIAKKYSPFSKKFPIFLLAAIILIMIATFPYIFYDKLLNYISDIQIIYFSHFVFYGALSFIFLAFRNLSYLGGVYEDVKKIDPNSK
jgi:hypothetical protein